MGGGKKVRQTRKTPLALEGTLHKSFKATAKAKAEPAQIPRKQLTSGFLSYISSAMHSKTDGVADQAKFLHQHYLSMTPEQKRQMVTDFYKSGGKRSGLESTYKQALSFSTKAAGGEWSGYVNLDGLMDLWKASLGII